MKETLFLVLSIVHCVHYALTVLPFKYKKISYANRINKLKGENASVRFKSVQTSTFIETHKNMDLLRKNMVHLNILRVYFGFDRGI